MRSEGVLTALPASWTWFTDCQYGFQVPVPPGWTAGSYEYASAFSTQHRVLLLPPGVNAPFTVDTTNSQRQFLLLSVWLTPDDMDTRSPATPPRPPSRAASRWAA